jgi:hypothetical protein
MKNSQLLRACLLGILVAAIYDAATEASGETQNHQGTDQQMTLRMAVRIAAREANEPEKPALTPLGKLIRETPYEAISVDEMVPLYAQQILQASSRNALFVKSVEQPLLAVIRIPDSYAIDAPLFAALSTKEGIRLASWKVWNGYFMEADPPYPNEVYFPKCPVEKVCGAQGLRIKLLFKGDDEALTELADIPLYPWQDCVQ